MCHDARTKTFWHVLELLLQRSLIVEVLSDGKLPVDAFLRDVEVLDIEEAVLAHALDEGLRELLAALGRAVQAQVDRNEVCPVEVLLWCKLW